MPGFTTLHRTLGALALAVSTAAAGHAMLLKASLDGQPLPACTATTVTLHFNARLELPFSGVALVGAGADPRNLAFKAGAQPGDVQVELPPLPEGSYALRYRVRAPDGHFTEDIVRFRVAEVYTARN